jgi:hypothetical protein
MRTILLLWWLIRQYLQWMTSAMISDWFNYSLQVQS